MFALRAALHRRIHTSLAPPRVAHARTPAALGLGYESVRIPTLNRRSLHGWFVPPSPGVARPFGAVVVVHGWGGNAAMMLPLVAPSRGAGLAALFIDSRCHGASDDDSFASLPRFAEDVESSLDWLLARADIASHRVGLIGHSVGAGAVLLAASRRPEVAAVVSIAAFAHPRVVMQRWLRSKWIPPFPIGNYILSYVQATIGHRFDDIAPVSTIARVRCPVLIAHGRSDTVVPFADAGALLAAAGSASVELLALHGDHESFSNVAAELDRLRNFLERTLGGHPRAGS